MTTSSLGQTELSQLLLRLYRLSHENPITTFQDAALNLLREYLPFDSSMWGTATNTENGIDIHTIHLHNQPEDMLLSYEEVKHLDTAAQAVAQRPRHTLGFNARDWFSRPEQAALREHGRRFEQANFFIASDVDVHTQFVHWVTLFRADAAARCQAQESDLLALLAPHFMQALTLNRITHLDRMEGAVAPPGSAISDPRGVIYHADDAFKTLLGTEWSHWRGSERLPDALLQEFQRGSDLYRGMGIVVTQRRDQGLLFLHARRRLQVDELSEREQLVAELVASGQNHKQIAQTLQRSPATVRNQIRSIYSKLQVGNVASLIKALNSAQ